LTIMRLQRLLRLRLAEVISHAACATGKEILFHENEMD
jgi:hypothetical protein